MFKINYDNFSYSDNVAQDVMSTLPKNQAFIRQLQQEGYKIIEYCRKSNVESKNRTVLLQRMTNLLRE